MSSEPDDADQKTPVEESAEPVEKATAYLVIKWLAIIFLGIPLGLIVITALVFGVCMIAMN